MPLSINVKSHRETGSRVVQLAVRSRSFSKEVKPCGKVDDAMLTCAHFLSVHLSSVGSML